MNARPPGSTAPSIPDPRERLIDLLVARATEGLAPHELDEMHRLLDQHPDVDPGAFDHAAAGAMLAMVGDDDARVELPANLRQRLIDSCPLTASRTPAPIAGRSAPTRRALSGRLGWAVAATLALVAAAGWWTALRTPTTSPGTYTPPLVAMDRFLRSTPDAVTLPLAGAAAGFEKATGEVVWSDQQQTGYFRIADLAPNDPAQAQYQLWIVDPTRDSKPVDGGVFDITPGQNVVKIHAKLHVDKPAIFAITKEKPGGVVVSAGPLLVVAKR